MSEETFGDRLTTEREDRGLSVDAVAKTLGVDREHLLALERNEFESLPDEAEMAACLHAYAECLDVDAELMIEDYVRERDRSRRAPHDAVTEPPPLQAEILPGVESLPKARSRPRLPLGLVVPVVVGIVLLVMWGIFSRDRAAPTSDASSAESQVLSSTTSADVGVTPVGPVAEEAAPTRVEPEATDSGTAPEQPEVTQSAPAPVEPPAARPEPVTPAATDLRITEHGVGAAVENRELRGRSDRFAVGSRVYFWTRVEGARRGERIDHVWLLRGVETARVSLEIGGPNWRTHSIMTLPGGADGDWAVEARDSAGRVLARSEFVGTR